jgi:endonuclease/exonuclease/phosphatase family metal-dependent hydrolase
MLSHSILTRTLRTATMAAALFIGSLSAASAQTAACPVALSAPSMYVGVGEANWSIGVTAAASCAWSVSSQSDWLVVRATTPAVVVGAGSFKLRAVANTTSAAKRTGRVSINGALYTVTQGGCGSSCAAPTPAPPAPPAPQPEPAPVTTPPMPRSNNTLRLMQYNTHHGGWGSDGVYSPERIVAQIVKANPDVVSLQEIEQNDSWSKGKDQTEVYQTLLQSATGKIWYKVFMNRFGSTSGNGNLILSTIPFIATATQLLPANRSAVDATIDVNGRVINITSAHLDNETQSNRLSEIKALIAWDATFAEQRIIVGDFNAWPNTTELTNMKNGGYVDVWPVAQKAGTARGTGITHGAHRIDYVFTSKDATFLKLVSIEIMKTADAAGVTPSDHEPVLAVFEVQ